MADGNRRYKSEKKDYKEIKELYLSGRNLRVTSFYGWKKYAYEMED